MSTLPNDHDAQYYDTPFPPSAQKLITDYHRAHSNSLRLAHCVGPASEKFVLFLADFFQHVHISHPDSAILARTRDRLGEFHSTNWWKSKFSFSQSEMEESHLGVAKGSVDMAFLLTSEGWTNPDKIVESVAESLSPNGTMVILAWSQPPKLTNSPNDHLAPLIEELLDLWIQTFAAQNKEILSLYNSPLDCISLRHEEGDAIWIQDVTKRININGNRHAFIIPVAREIAESRVGPKQRRYFFEEEDTDGKGWRREVDGSWFRGWVERTLRGEVDGELGRKVDEVERVLCDGKVELVWSAAILLATRK